MSNDHSPLKKILLWSVIVASVLSVVAMVVFGWYVWRSHKRAQIVTSAGGSPKPSSAANWAPGNFSGNAPEAVRQTSDKSWSVKGGRAFMQVRRKNDESLELRFVYPFDELPPETTSLVQTRWRYGDVEKVADSLNITSEQLASLKAVSPGTDMPVPGADRDRLRELFEDYLAGTDKPAAERALVEAVAELDAKYHDQTQERINAIAEKVKAIFTPDQLAALSERFAPRRR